MKRDLTGLVKLAVNHEMNYGRGQSTAKNFFSQFGKKDTWHDMAEFYKRENLALANSLAGGAVELTRLAGMPGMAVQHLASKAIGDKTSWSDRFKNYNSQYNGIRDTLDNWEKRNYGKYKDKSLEGGVTQKAIDWYGAGGAMAISAGIPVPGLGGTKALSAGKGLLTKVAPKTMAAISKSPMAARAVNSLTQGLRYGGFTPGKMLMAPALEPAMTRAVVGGPAGDSSATYADNGRQLIDIIPGAYYPSRVASLWHDMRLGQKLGTTEYGNPITKNYQNVMNEYSKLYDLAEKYESNPTPELADQIRVLSENINGKIQGMGYSSVEDFINNPEVNANSGWSNKYNPNQDIYSALSQIGLGIGAVKSWNPLMMGIEGQLRKNVDPEYNSTGDWLGTAVYGGAPVFPGGRLGGAIQTAWMLKDMYPMLPVLWNMYMSNGQ